MNEKELKQGRSTGWIGKQLFWFEETDSTNNEAKRSSGAEHGALFLADCQTGGRGRLGRSFSSPHDTGIYMTLLLKPKIQAGNASRLTLVTALSVRKAILTCCGLKAGIKWPNDIILRGKKVCGILTEMRLLGSSIEYVIIGIGINVNNTEFPAEIREVATSLYLESGKRYDRIPLIWETMRAFETYYETFLQTEDLSELMEEYQELMVNPGGKVEIMDKEEPFTGLSRGINKEGELLVETENGIKAVSSGEISVRGVYGYV